MKVAVGSDHAGFEMKGFLIAELSRKDYEMLDCGTYSSDSADYPDFAREVAALINQGKADYGIIICGTGIGISIAANKINGIRAALCHNEFCAEMARKHNNANVLALGSGLIGNLLALKIAETFLDVDFTNEERHLRRIKKISDSEN